MRNSEKIIVILIVIGLFLKIFHLPAAGIILVVSLSTLSLMYLASAFFFTKKLNNQNLPFSITSGIFMSIAVLGILFKLLFWPGGGAMLIISLLPLLLLCIINVLYFLNKKVNIDFYKLLLIRTLVVLLLSSLLYFLPKYTLYRFLHNDEKQIELWIKASESELESDWDEFYKYLDEKQL